ncbi:hypothetical protein FRC11_006394 [Ceratobasidium sp. 423]|nr:hypothetical protein FRC11_006394 [Ceratobasidium sp. 423]
MPTGTSGEGSRKDAVRRVGCAAHDIIQWFSGGQYESDSRSKQAPELVIQVWFEKLPDLKDVRMICCGVQKVKRSQDYTLQRYNYYFLCLAVLTLLVRDATEWPSAVTGNSWGDDVNDAILQLQGLKWYDVHQYLGFGFCHLVAPDILEQHTHLLGLLGDALRKDGQFDTAKVIHETLWHEDLGLATHRGLLQTIRGTAHNLLTAGDSYNIQLSQLLSGSEFESTKETMTPEFQRRTRVALVKGTVNIMRNSARAVEATYTMREVEDPTPFGVEFVFFVPLWDVITEKLHTSSG